MKTSSCYFHFISSYLCIYLYLFYSMQFIKTLTELNKAIGIYVLSCHFGDPTAYKKRLFCIIIY